MAIEIQYLGIDFGSCSTAFIGISVDENGLHTFHQLCDPKTDAPCFDTLLYRDEDGTVVIGAEARARRGQGRLYHSPKETVLKSENEGEGREVVRLYLEAIFNALRAKYSFRKLKAVCFGHPNYHQAQTTADYNKTVTEALEAIFADACDGRPVITPATEPLLAAISYVQTDTAFGGDEGYPFLVVDCGGHTIDFSFAKVTERNGNEVTLAAPSTPQSFSGDECPAVGMYITKVICRKIGKVENLPTFTYADTVEAAKRHFFSEVATQDYRKNTALSVRIAPNEPIFGGTYTLKYKREDGDDPISTVSLIDDFKIHLFFEQAGKFAKDYLDLWCKTVESIPSRILFVGGASRMAPLCTEIVKNIREGLLQLILDCAKTESERAEADRRVRGLSYSTIDGMKRTEVAPGRIALTPENAVAYGAALVAWKPLLYDANAEITVTHDRELAGLNHARGEALSYKRRLIGIRQRLIECRDMTDVPALLDELRALWDI